METTLKFKPNEKQQLAIRAIDGQVMVLAGPGTGKTFTIIERIKYMIKHEKISPERILCMTFSEAAASEMKTRLEKEIGQAAYSVKIDTYHAFCSEIIREYPNKFGLKEDFEVIDDLKKFTLMKEVLSEYKPKLNKSKMGDIFGEIDNLISKVSKIKRSLVTKEEFDFIAKNGFAWQGEISRLEEKIAEAKSKNRGTKGNEEKIEEIKNKIEKAQEVWEIYELYNKKIHDNNLIDFDDMIIMVLDKFKEDKEFLREISHHWDYICVDEYQDTNNAQNSLIFTLEQGRGLGNLFVVGDDDQLIYAFQGAQMDTLEKFLELYPKTQVICLNENNRSTQTILDYSDAIISQDPLRIGNNPNFKSKNILKKLIAKNKDVIEKERKIQIHRFSDIKQENNFIIDEILKILNSDELPVKENGDPDLSQIAVLASTNSELEEFATLLKGKGILYQIRTTKNIFEIKSVILTYFYLKVLENSKMFMDKLFGMLLCAPFSFDETDYSFLISKLNIKNGDDFISLIRQNLNHNWTDKEKVHNFIKIYDELKQIKDGSSIKDTILAIINKTGILPHFASSPVNRYDNIMGLKKLLEQAENFSKFQRTYSITDFVKYLDLAYNNDIEIKTDEDLFTKNAIQLSTIHSSKGKEYSYVFMVNLISSKWESSTKSCSDDFSLPIRDYSNKFADLKDLKNTMKMSENLKKLFVGITRAKYGLYLTYSDYNGKKSQKMTSYLSNVLCPELVEHHSHSLDTEKFVNEIVKNLSQEKLNYSLSLRKEVESMMEDFVLSATSMNAYLNCPQNFLYSYVLRIPTQDTDTTALNYGNTIHSVMEWIYKDNEDYPSLNEIQEKFKKELSLRPFNSKTTREMLEQRGLENLENFYPMLTATPFKRVIETETDINTYYENWKIKGKIDRVEKNDDGTYTICDYKTGNGEGKDREIKEGGNYENYYNQLKFYKLLYELEHPERTVSKAAVIYVETQNIIERQFTKEEMDNLKDNIKFVYENLQDLYFDVDTKDDNKCKYCSFKQMCSLM